MTQNFFKPFIEAVKPYKPGKPIKELERELGVRNPLKLASNENPLGASKKALRAVRRALLDVHLYPEGGCFYLVDRLAQELDVGTRQIIAGNGSNELIELLCRGFVSEGDEVISSEKSFLVYPILTQVCGAKFVEVPMKDFRYDLEAIAEAITDKTKVIFIANPNNPTGTFVTKAEVDVFLKKVPEHVIVCFDEAYLDFVDNSSFPHMLNYLKKGIKNLVLMRTFSKAYGLAGLRVGYAVGHIDVIGYLHKIRQPFNVNSLAQVAATAALDDRFFIWRTKRLVASGRKYLYRRFDQLGCKYLPSQANFILVDTGHDADLVYQALLKKGLIVRSMKEYGLPTWIRVTIGRRSQNALFYRLFRAYIKQGS